jgi:hypothetical protein
MIAGAMFAAGWTASGKIVCGAFTFEVSGVGDFAGSAVSLCDGFVC